MSKAFKFSTYKVRGLSISPDCKAKQVEFVDLRHSNLSVIAYRSGKKTYSVRYLIRGVRNRISIGDADVIEYEEAVEKCNEIKKLLGQGKNPKTHEEEGSITFKEFCQKYYLPHAYAVKKSAKADESKLNKYINGEIGDLPIANIKRRDVILYIGRRRSTLAVATCNKHQSLLKGVIRLAAELELIEESPIESLKQQRENNQVETFLDEEQAAQFVAELNGLKNEIVANLLIFLLFTGLRIGEAIDAKLKHYCKRSGTLEIPCPKNGRKRRVHLNTTARKIIEGRYNHSEAEDYIFPGKKGRLSPPQRIFKRIAEKIGVPNLRIHDLRHSFAGFASQANLSTKEIASLLGHASVRSTERYLHISNQREAGAAENVAEIINLAINSSSKAGVDQNEIVNMTVTNDAAAIGTIQPPANIEGASDVIK